MNVGLRKQINLHCKRLARANTSAYVYAVRRSLNAILADGVEKAQLHLDARAMMVSKYTIRDYVGRVRSFGKAFNIPELKGVVRPAAHGTPKLRAVFTREEVLKLAGCAKIPPARRLYWRLLYRCGLRPSEARTVTKSSVDLRGEEGFLLIAEADQKARRPDPIAAPADLAKLIRALAPDTPSGWDAVLRGKRYLPDVFSEDMNAAGIGAMQGDAKRVPKDLRAFFVTELFRQKLDLETVRIMARHANIETTLAHYLKMQAEDAIARGREALDGL